MVDFTALPPEINSGLMYAGAGAGPLVEAATAWAGLAEELESAAETCAAVLSELSTSDWRGPAAAAMCAAASPYPVWMRTTAGHAAWAASQAAAAANTYQVAFAAIVPPPVVAENRLRTAALIGTNVFGQNSAAIAAAEAAYAEMWAQDATVMCRYAGDSAVATALRPLTAPPVITTGADPSGQPVQAAAAGSTVVKLARLVGDLPGAVQALTASPMGGANIFSPGNATVDVGLSGLLNALSGHTNSAFGSLLNTNFGDSIFSSGFANPTGVFNVFNSFDYLLTYAAQDLVAAHPVDGAGALAPISAQVGSTAPAPAPSATFASLTDVHRGPVAVTAETGEATLSGSLRVPQRWANACAATTTIGANTANPEPSLAAMGAGAGSTALPAAPANGAPRGKSRYGRRYGFRPVVMAHPPAGG